MKNLSEKGGLNIKRNSYEMLPAGVGSNLYQQI